MKRVVFLFLPFPLPASPLHLLVCAQEDYWVSKRVVYPDLWNVPQDKITNDGIILETKLKPVLNNETGYYDLYPERPNGLIVTFAGLPAFYLNIEIPDDPNYIQYPAIVHLYHESVKEKTILYMKIRATYSYTGANGAQYYIFSVTLFTYRIDLETQTTTLVDYDDSTFVVNTTSKSVEIYCIPDFYSYELQENDTTYTVLIMGFEFLLKTDLTETRLTIAYDSYYLAQNETLKSNYSEYIERLRDLNGWKGFIGVGIAEYLPYYSHIEIYHTSYNATNPPPNLYDKFTIKEYAFEDWYFDPQKLLVYFSRGLLEEYSGVMLQQKFEAGIANPRIVDYYLAFLVPLAIAYSLKKYVDPFFVYIVSFVFLNMFFGLEFPIMLSTLIGGLAGFMYGRRMGT